VLGKRYPGCNPNSAISDHRPAAVSDLLQLGRCSSFINQ
jgi:hypothetical protein